ncbi:MAG: hypothetical protein JNJ70_17585 [Verrucomicrobiales bacterium]|nr:hypothetical protein [Verrucomicrobiales bacterium]
MKLSTLLLLPALALAVLGLVSCESTDSGPKPQGERLSSMPHNMPAPWEGQAGMPGMMSGQY